MQYYSLSIDGKEVQGVPGQTILEVCRENDIFIPTLCYDERTRIYGSCGICVVEVDGNPKLVKACATVIAPKMIVKTNTERVIESRKTNLELLLSNHTGDCRPPCVRACPAQTDCQGYVGLIANGEYGKALELVKDRLPLPASLGRVCPHPCEKDCRRGLIDEPISIQMLKRFVADKDLAGDERFVPEIGKETRKRVAIIGGGPMGLSAAYFLRQMGHGVTIYEAMPKPGGMLRYGIPEYRLPKAVLEDEIKTIQMMGVDIQCNTKIGEDISFEAIQADYDAVLLGIGAWVSTGVGCPGEDAENIIGGIDFLRRVVRNQPMHLGKKVAIVGGGNTAMDTCRTAVRLGADEVYNIYRRTKDEMPADRVEIEEAEEEGVIFKNLTNPIEFVKDEDGAVKQVRLQCMDLGEPDASGRRKPIPVEGKIETLDVDTVILAIGQAVDASFFDCDKTRKGGIAYDTETFMTSIPGVFAGGDCGNDKISIAVEAIADAKKVSTVIDEYLAGVKVKYEEPYFVHRDDITEKTFEDRERMCRPEIPQLSAEERKNNFSEVIPEGFTEDQAEEEANRCLECGCHDYFECKLVSLANEYEVKPERFAGEKNIIEYEDEHPFILRDPNKCILCGRCVRVCAQVMRIGALGLVGRGFDTVIKPNMEKALAESGCISCGQCVTVCPTGALQEKTSIAKAVPLKKEETVTTCPYCSIGCTIVLETCGNLLIRAVPDKNGAVNKGISCGRGKFGFDCATLENKLMLPLVKGKDGFRETDYHESLTLIAKRMQSVAAKYGRDAIGVSISDRFTNEEAYAMKRMAEAMGAKVFSANSIKSGMEPVLGFDASPNTISELDSTDFILVAGYSPKDNPIIQVRLKVAVNNGAKVVVVNPKESPISVPGLVKEVYTDDLTLLKEVAKAIVDIKGKQDIPGFDKFARSLRKIEPSEEAIEIAKMYVEAKKAMIVFSQHKITVEAATLLANMAVASGHIGGPRDGILQLKGKNNGQGLIDMGITEGIETMEDLKAMLVFGEEFDIDPDQFDFLAVCDTHMTQLAAKADVVLPCNGFAAVRGTFTNTERRLQRVRRAIDEGLEMSNWEVAKSIAHIFEVDCEWESTADIRDEMELTVPKYTKAVVGQILGGVLTPENICMQPIKGNDFADINPCTDSLMNVISERLPQRANPTDPVK